MLKWEYRNPEEVAIRREEERLAAEAKKKRKISSVEANEMLKNESSSTFGQSNGKSGTVRNRTLCLPQNIIGRRNARLRTDKA